MKEFFMINVPMWVYLLGCVLSSIVATAVTHYRSER